MTAAAAGATRPLRIACLEVDPSIKWEGLTEKYVRSSFCRADDELILFEIARKGEYPLVEDVAAGKYDVLFIGGSHHSAYQTDVPWLVKLREELIPAYYDANKDVKIVGLCFGHQILAAALGGKVGKNPSGRFVLKVEDIVFDSATLESSGLDASLLHQREITNEQASAAPLAFPSGPSVVPSPGEAAAPAPVMAVAVVASGSDLKSRPISLEAEESDGDDEDQRRGRNMSVVPGTQQRGILPSPSDPPTATYTSAGPSASATSSSSSSLFPQASSSSAHPSSSSFPAPPPPASTTTATTTKALLHSSSSSSPTLRLVESHGDQVLELPAGGVLLASSGTAQCEMWTMPGRLLGSQFHPEFPSTEIVLTNIHTALSGNGILNPEESQLAEVSLRYTLPDPWPVRRLFRAFMEGRPPPPPSSSLGGERGVEGGEGAEGAALRRKEEEGELARELEGLTSHLKAAFSAGLKEGGLEVDKLAKLDSVAAGKVGALADVTEALAGFTQQLAERQRQAVVAPLPPPPLTTAAPPISHSSSSLAPPPPFPSSTSSASSRAPLPLPLQPLPPSPGPLAELEIQVDALSRAVDELDAQSKALAGSVGLPSEPEGGKGGEGGGGGGGMMGGIVDMLSSGWRSPATAGSVPQR